MTASNKYRFTVRLKQHTPIIHFQHDQPGATLRATEVKPKLDRFIFQLLGKEVAEMKGEKLSNAGLLETGAAKAKENEWLIGTKENFALNYKLRIVAKGKPKKGRITIIPPDKKKTLYFHDSCVELNVTSFSSDLINKIEENIDCFFALHNFGMRQNKGWGSFLPEFMSEKKIEELLKKSGKSVYKYNGKLNGCTGYNFFKGYKEIMRKWTLLKSGINYEGYQKSYLFKYMSSKGIRWEKRAIKHALKKIINEKNWGRLNGRKPPVDISSNDDLVCGTDYNEIRAGWEKEYMDNIDSYRFVRFLLGMPEHYEFRSKNSVIYQVKIKPASGQDIERFKAPVTFKILKGNLYAIAEVDDIAKLYDKGVPSFSFCVQKKVKKNGQWIKSENSEKDLMLTLSIPNKDEFCLKEFLDLYFWCIGFKSLI